LFAYGGEDHETSDPDQFADPGIQDAGIRRSCGVSLMTRLILTTTDSGAGGLRRAGLADCVGAFGMRFVWGELSSQIHLDTWLAPRPTKHDVSGSHWLDGTSWWLKEARAGEGLIEFCERFAEVALWVDPDPNSQLTLIWLLDYLERHAMTPSKLTLVQADASIGNCTPEELAGWRLPSIKIQNDHFKAAGRSWPAYRQPTPQAWSDLLREELGLLPQLRSSVLELLEELPTSATGLGATQMRILELISEGGAGPFDVFPGHEKPNKRRVFDYWEVGELLDGLVYCRAPAVAGLEGRFTLEMHDDQDRLARYKRSKLELTALGKAILAGTEDFSRHNQLHRWWGGTELISDRLWRWDPAARHLVAP
jgi:hypothetical protein